MPAWPSRPQPARLTRRHRHLPGWRRDALQTTLWFIPSILVLVAVALFAITYALDRAVDAGNLDLPLWVNSGSADAARTILTAIAAAIITVVGVVFSVTILALTLASTQFGPRMLRNFIRDRGTQATLGIFVATFVFSVLALGSVSNEVGRSAFVPHISVTVALALTLLDLGVLIYFIHHVATSIQLTAVVYGIAGDLDRALHDLASEVARPHPAPAGSPSPASSAELLRRLDTEGVELPAPSSGYLQAIGHERLVRIAAANEAIVRMASRPGHFVVRGRPLAVVWPSDAVPTIATAFQRAQAIGPHRTLQQDLQFAIDQLVEISLRALSPAVNDTFTALTCIDWLGDALCKLTAIGIPDGLHYDDQGRVRLVEVPLRYERAVDRAFDKIRQSARGMPAVGIRQLENLAKIAEYATDNAQTRGDRAPGGDDRPWRRRGGAGALRPRGRPRRARAGRRRAGERRREVGTSRADGRVEPTETLKLQLPAPCAASAAPSWSARATATTRASSVTPTDGFGSRTIEPTCFPPPTTGSRTPSGGSASSPSGPTRRYGLSMRPERSRIGSAGPVASTSNRHATRSMRRAISVTVKSMSSWSPAPAATRAATRRMLSSSSRPRLASFVRRRACTASWPTASPMASRMSEVSTSLESLMRSE